MSGSARQEPKDLGEYDLILWYDLETTGTDHDTCEVLEFGGLVTDPDLVPVGMPLSVTIRPTEAGLAQIAETPVVVEMHEANGLLQECLDSGIPADSAGELISVWLYSFQIKSKRFLSAGSGVSHFDRRIVERVWPGVESWLAYPNYDVGVFRRGLGISGATFVRHDRGSKTHRALADAQAAWREAKHYQDVLSAVDGMLRASGTLISSGIALGADGMPAVVDWP